MPIALLPHSLHTGRGTTRLEKSLRHNKTDCIITFFFLPFFPLQGAFVLLTSPARKGNKKKKEVVAAEGEKRTRDLRWRRQYPFL